MTFMTNLEGNFFTQERRDELQRWLTCAGVGDIDMPEGEPDPVYCQDPLNSGKLKIEGFVYGAPGSSTYSLTKPLASTLNFLLNVKCKFVGRVNWVCRGSRQDPQNYQVALLMIDSAIRRRGIVNPASFEPPEARVNTNADLAFATPLVVHRLNFSRQSVTNTADGNAIHFLPARCEDKCGTARDLCEYGLIGLDGPGAYAYESEIKKTHDGGANWAATAVDPYSFGGDTLEVLQLETFDGVRYVVFRGSQVVGAPAECGISDDYGLSWDNRFIGNHFGQFVTAITMRGADIFVGCNDGYIYISEDNANNWAESEDGDAGTDRIYDICFYGDYYGYAVGANNGFKRTGDGGNTWEAVVGPALGCDLLSCDTNDQGHLFVTTDDGRVFRSDDRGTTWVGTDGTAGAAWLDLGGGTIEMLRFEPDADYAGFLAYNDATPVGHIYRTEDGGRTWFEMDGVPDNNGINAIHVCDVNHVAMVGPAHDATTFIAMSQICMA